MPCVEELARYFLASDLGIVESSTHFIYNGQRIKEVKTAMFTVPQEQNLQFLNFFPFWVKPRKHEVCCLVWNQMTKKHALVRP